MDSEDFGSLQEGEQQAGEYTLAEIEVDMESQLTPNDLDPGATVLLSIEGDEDGERIMSHEDLSRWFLVEPAASPAPMPTDVVVQRTLEDPALKQILQEADGKPDFDPEAEQMKIRSFLAGITHSKMTTEQSVFQGYRPNTTGFGNRSKCPDCLGSFDASSFQNHLCSTEVERKSNQKSVAEAVADKQAEKPPAAAAAAPDPPAPPSPSKPNSIRVVAENQIRLRRFLNDELKYDINPGVDGSSSRKSGKGLHECSKCDRKFVHASGLVRHMEKHVLDLIPSQSKPQPAASLAAGLTAVVKCNFCGRIFYDPQVALEHAHVHFEVHPIANSQSETAVKYTTNVDFKQLIKDTESLLSDVCSGAAKLGKQKNMEVLVKMEKLEKPEELKKLENLKKVEILNSLEENLFSILVLGSVLQCEFCEYLFSDIRELLAHSATHPVKRRFECTACDIKMDTAKEARLHFETDCIFMRESLKSLSVSVSRFFACNVCELKFANSELLQEHRCTYHHYFPRLSPHGASLLLPCEFCEVIFESAREVQPHNEEKHLSKKKREKETRGSTTSGRQRQYLCDICGKSYTQSSHLWQHLRFHQGVKPFVCPEDKCDRKFTIRPDLNDHIRKCHTGERPFHCQTCGKRFLTGSVFYQHRLIHRGERRYECEQCGKRFYRADALKNHQRIHTGEKPFSCLFCTKTFRQRGDRDKHMRARHAHLDANSRLMMQMQKFQLESAAAAKAKGEKTPSGVAMAACGSHPLAEGLEPGEVVASEEHLHDPEPNGDMPNYFVVDEYVEGEPGENDLNGFNMQQGVCTLEEEGCTMEEEEQQIILYETQPGRDLNLGDDQQPGQDLITFDYKEANEEPMQDEDYVQMLQGDENARVVVVQNNPAQPMFSNSYM
ncbi:testis-specific zinc finger protein topi [Drosophila kikkawai]|uniref:Testis-specific zinc finger protein topi n=1 Tax=Drosophila kikkawai TaxID=30033 RepID=A0A6P4J331_DROKI|nr:testis-specific zinc finger protein topi [Drosophila kikkawai]